MYDNSKNNIRQFVFILNDTPDDRKFQDSLNSVKSQFEPSCIFEIKMSGNLMKEEQKQPLPDQWNDFIDIDMRTFEQNQVAKG